jgi:uncharacterized protein YeaO (DUF488 family)
MMLKTKRWNDPAEADDGTRILITRYRPRGVRHEDETWDVWIKELGPSTELHAAAYGKSGPPISVTEYRRRYLEEVSGEDYRLTGLAQLLLAGERMTLLCSSACIDETRCHRTLLRELLLERAAQLEGAHRKGVR